LDSRGSSRIVVGSDTIVVVDDEVLGKPLHIQDSFRMLSKLQGRTHQVYTGVACLSENYGDEAGLNIGSDAASYRGECCEYTVSNGAAGGRCVVGYSVTNVTFKPMSDDQIDRYISSGEPADKAGSYAAQGIGSTLISKLEGDYFGVVGLPLHLLSEMLREHGILTP
jgi:septum formation protein